jgi:prevent-host-death family protein
MSMMGIREFSKNISGFIEHVETSGEPAVVTRHGKPVVAIIPLNAEGFEDFVLSHLPEFAAGMRAANAELIRGETRPLADVIADIERDEAAADEDADRETAPEKSAC